MIKLPLLMLKTRQDGEIDKSREPLEARAIALVLSRPGITKKEIARVLTCHEKSLTPKRCPKLAAALQAYRASAPLPRGSKDRAGNLEAWNEEG